MDLIADPKWPWVLPVVAGLVLLLLAWWSRRRRPRLDPEALWVAKTSRMRALPRYRALLRRHRLAGLLLTLAALVVVAGAAVVLARPQEVQTVEPETRDRDIVLCLDASASMDDDNVAVVQELRRLVDSLDGDRVGLVIWSSAAVLMFPLTDDYDYARAELDRMEEVFRKSAESQLSGIQLAGRRASLIGDGIASCVKRFARNNDGSARTVLVSSDNKPIGRQVFPLPQAAEYAVKRDVVVYGIGADLDDPRRASAREEFADAVAATGGVLETVGTDGDTDRIIQRIDELDRARLAEPPRRVTYDDPDLGVLVSGAGLVLLLLAWSTRSLGVVRRGGPG